MPQFSKMIQSGSEIALIKKKSTIKAEYSDIRIIEKANLKKIIITPNDNREMVLVSGGSFLFGTNNGELDEYPEQKIILPDYYIDKYEV